jgi:hypothetical protein
MGHLLKLKCAHSPLNLRILSALSVPFTTHDGASAKISTNSHETDNSEGEDAEIKRGGEQGKGNLSLSVSGYVCGSANKTWEGVGGGGLLCSLMCNMGTVSFNSKDDLSYFSDRILFVGILYIGS